MKTITVFISVLLIGISVSSLASNPHAWSGEKKRTVWKNWSLSVNAGVTSYFGDLSKYDNDVFGKLRYESEPAFSVMLNKQFGGAFGVGGQLLYGGLSNQRSEISDFRTDFMEYNVQARLDIIDVINGPDPSDFGLTLFAGVGQFLFKTTDYTYNEGDSRRNIHSTGVPEFVYFGGGELSYALNERIAVTLDLAVRQAQNDKLDNMVRGDDFDYYSFTSIGITYRFKDLFGTHKTSNLLRNNFPYGYR